MLVHVEQKGVLGCGLVRLLELVVVAPQSGLCWVVRSLFLLVEPCIWVADYGCMGKKCGSLLE
jgi:hypothetical protein